MGRELHSFVGNTTLTMFSKLLPIGIAIAYTYLIANYLGPEQYGQFNYILAFVANIFLLLGAGALNELLLVFFQKKPSKEMLYKILGAEYAISILLLAAFLVFSGNIGLFESYSADVLTLSALLLLLLPVNTIAISFYRSAKHFGKLLKATTIESGLNLLLALAATFVFQAGIIGLVAAKLFSVAVSGAYFAHVFLRHDTPAKAELPVWEMKRFIKWNFPHDITRVGIHQARLIFLGFISPIQLGFYYFGQKLCDLSFGTINSSISDVLFVYANQASEDKQKLANYISLSIRVSMYINAIVLAGLALFTPIILSLFLPHYSDAYPLILLWGISYLTGPIAQVTHAFKVLNRMKEAFLLILLVLAVNIVFLWLFAPAYGAFAVVGSMILTNAINFLVYLPVLGSVGVPISLLPRKEDLMILKSVLDGILGKIRK